MATTTASCWTLWRAFPRRIAERSSFVVCRSPTRRAKCDCGREASVAVEELEVDYDELRGVDSDVMRLF